MYCSLYCKTELQYKKPHSDIIIDLKNIFTSFRWLSYNLRWVRVVILRKDLKLTHYILGKKYALLNIKTIQNLKFDITQYYINFICVNGNVDILTYLLKRWLKSGKKSILELKYNEDALRLASKHGHINVLDWWLGASKEFSIELKYDENALKDASWNGHVNVLEWWLKSGLELKYSEDALTVASFNEHVNVLDWWLKSGLELKYSEVALNWASMYGHVNVLDWWLKSGLELKYDENALNWASRYGRVNVLD